MDGFVCMLIAAGAIGATSSMASGQAGVQASSCTYARCALHVETVPGAEHSSRLVQGIESRPVETSGFFTVRIPLFETSPDSVRAPYREFQTHTRATRGLFAVAVVSAVASAAFIAATRPAHFASTLPELGLDVGLGIGGLIQAKQADDALQTAITRYNAGLPNG